MKAAILVKLALLALLSYSCGTYDNEYFLMPYREGDRWGLCDTLGKVQVKPQYDGFMEMIIDQQSKQSFYFVKKDGRTVVVDHNNEQHLKEYDSVDPGHQRIYKNGKVGLYFYKSGNAYQKTIGSFVIYADAIYTSIEPMEARGMYMLDLNGKKGLLRTEYGRASIVLQAEYDKIVFDKPVYNAYKGEIVEAQYRDPKQSSSGGGDISMGGTSKEEQEREKEKQKQKDEEYRRKLIENLKKDTSPEDLKKIMPFEITPINKYIKVRENGMQGLAHFSYSLSGPTKQLIKVDVIPAIYDSISESGPTNFLIKKDGKYGYRRQRKVLLEPIYENVKFFSTNMNGLLVEKDGKYAVYLLVESKFVTDFIYDDYTLLPVTGYPPHLILHKNGKKILWDYDRPSSEYDELTTLTKTSTEERVDYYGYAIKSRKGSKYGALKEGKTLLPAEYDDVYISVDGLFLIPVIDGKKGIFSESILTNIPPKYKSVEFFKRFSIGEKNYPVYKVTDRNDKIFYTDRNGKEFYKS